MARPTNRFTIVGKLFNDSSIKIICNDERAFTLCGWNGNSFTECWEVYDNDGFFAVGEAKYNITPVYEFGELSDYLVEER